MKKIKMLLYQITALFAAFAFALPAAAASVDLDAVYPISTNEIPGWPAGTGNFL